MEIKLECKCCGKHMAILRDAKVRKGMAVYCAECDTIIDKLLSRKERDESYGVPDFMRGLFGR